MLLNATRAAPLHRTVSSSFFVTSVLLVITCSIGLALDYDIFLLSRMRMCRQEGYGPDEAIVKALNDTGSTISAAACIMVVAFGSNILADTPFLNQMALLLSVAVLSDAFYTRPILVPSVCSIGGDLMWWPMQMPQPTRSLDGEVAGQAYGAYAPVSTV